MRRVARTPRPDSIQNIEQLGLTFHTVDNSPYWNEAAAYEFDAHEITTLEQATQQLHEMCLQAVEFVIEKDQFDRLKIPLEARPIIVQAWEADPPAIYGRFDLAFDGQGAPKLLEYNADTPTSLLEAAVVQWHWLQDIEPQADQFNSIWEGLVAKWQSLEAEGYLSSGIVHFACMDSKEDLMTTAVLMDTAHEAGLEVSLMPMAKIGWDHDDSKFVDHRHRPIQTIFKLYPWEWMVRDAFGPLALKHYADVQWMEPIWKMMVSNKAILAILWELFPGHPNLLPAYLDGPRDLTDYVSKPFLGREGANVSIVQSGSSAEKTLGPYDTDDLVFQQYAPLPVFEGNHTVIGSWVIDGEARGIGVRESDGPITEDLARFVPHYFWPKPDSANSIMVKS